MKLGRAAHLTNLFFCTLFLALSACNAKKGNDDVLRMRLPGDPPRIDWNLATDNVSKEVIYSIQEGLLWVDSSGKVMPGLAESWSISPDGLTYTFKLRPGLKWTDGQPVKAQHFVDGWERLLNKKTASEYSYFLYDLVGGEDYYKGVITDFGKVGAKATDDLTLVATLRTPVAYWILIPTFWLTFPIRKDVIEKYGDKWTDPANIVTIGVYKMKTWDRESRIVCEKNPNYYDQAVEAAVPSKIEFRVVKEDSTAINLFRSHDLDIVRDLPPIQIPTLSKTPEFQADPYLRGYYVGFNTKLPPTKDLKLRQALAHAINRDEFKTILGPMVNITKTWIPTGLAGYNPNRGIDYNPELAKKLWSEIKDKPKQLEYWFDQKEMNKLVAENLQSQWKRVLGVDVLLSSQEWKVYVRTLTSNKLPLYRMGWGADYGDPDTFMNLFTCHSGNNQTLMCNATYDKLISESAASQDPKVRAQKYDEAQKILLEDETAIVPIFTENNMHLVSQRVTGFHPNLMGDFSFREFRLKLK